MPGPLQETTGNKQWNCQNIYTTKREHKKATFSTIQWKDSTFKRCNLLGDQNEGISRKEDKKGDEVA